MCQGSECDKVDFFFYQGRLIISESYTGCWICLNKLEYALIISQYAWIYLSNTKYDWICWHIPEKTQWWICPNVSDTVNSIRWLYKLLSRYYWGKDVFRTLSKISDVWVQIRNQKFWRVVELGHFDKHFVEKHKKKKPRKETFWKVFSWIFLDSGGQVSL